MAYTNIRFVPGNIGLITSDEAEVPDRYFATDVDTGEEVELLEANDPQAGPEGTRFLARRAGEMFGSGDKAYLPFEAVDEQGNVIGTYNMQKNELSDFSKYGGAAIRTAATILAGQALMPSITEALGLPTDLFGTTQTMPSGFDADAVIDATRLANEGLSQQQIAQIVGQQYSFDPTLASKIAQVGFDNSFGALNATRLAEITTDPNAIQQNLIASGIDPSIAADMAQQAAMGLDAATIANDLANFYQGAQVFTNAGLLEGGSTLDEFGKQISTISSTGNAVNLTDLAKGVSNIADALNPTQQQPVVMGGGGGGRPQGVDFSNILGLLTGKASLLPAAQQYQRGLLG
jgi:hypothetical protein